jgi:myo-inositol-1(or 4)-monophosphatase
MNDSDLDLLRDAAREGGRIAMRMRGRAKVWSKAGGSPVTEADLKVDAYLKKTLLGARPDYGWLSEETADDLARLDTRRQFVVDPIDGTVAYFKRQPWFTVAVAVVEDARPVAAVVYAPALDELYEATAGGGARLNGEPVHASGCEALEDCGMLGDVRLFSEPAWPAMRVEKRNSIALRMALVGAGAFDAAVGLTPKADWDVCAGDLIAREGGARVTDHLGERFVFNKPLPAQPSLVCAAASLHPLILERVRPIRPDASA